MDEKNEKVAKKMIFPSPPVLWGGVWFGAEMASGDF
jgi:hypothetical protein